MKPLEPLLLFYQKLEDKLVEYREKEREALRGKKIQRWEWVGGNKKREEQIKQTDISEKEGDNRAREINSKLQTKREN